MDDLRVLCDVVKHHSFSQAAVVHGITQSAASQRVGQLEKRLGVILIDRSVRPLQPTSAGKVFLDGCEDLLERYDRLTARVTQYRTGASGLIRVDAIYSAGIDLLNQVKASYEPLHPGVEIVLEYKHPDEVYEAVKQRRCDLGILSYPKRWREVEVIRLRDEPMAVICSPSHPLAGQRQIHASQLSECSMVTFEPTLPVGRQIKQYLREHGANPKITSVFDNIDTIKNALAVTNQVSILPTRTTQREVAGGALTAIELVPALARPMCIIYRRTAGGNSGGHFGENSGGHSGGHSGVGRGGNGSTLSPLIQSFVESLLEHVGPNGDLIERCVTSKSSPSF